MYKIVHREHGHLPYLPETIEEAVLLLKQIIDFNPEDKKQYYIREIK